MPIHDVGYRGWDGPLTPAGVRWQVITEAGVRQAWRIAGLRRLVLFAWTPAVAAGVVFLIFEQAVRDPDYRRTIQVVLGEWLNSQPLAAAVGQDPASARHRVWSYLLMLFFRYPQGLAMMLVVGIVGPGLISRDVGSRAFLLYFSRPLNRLQYVVGKAGVLCAYLALITTLPALGIYVVGLLMSPSSEAFAQTWDLPLRIVGASAVLMAPTSAMMLMMSSLTAASRYASVAWYMVWILGWFAYANLTGVETWNRMSAAAAAGRRVEVLESSWTVLSPYHMLGKVQGLVFGLESLGNAQVIASLLVLTTVTVVSLMVLFRRVAAPMRI